MARTTRRGPSFTRALASSFVALAALAAFAFVAVVRPARAELADQRARFAAFQRTYVARRWERPVLRGAPHEGNAIDEQERALAVLRPLSPVLFRANRGALRAGAELCEGTRARLRDPRVNEALDRLRASTQRTWAWNPYSLRPEGNHPRASGDESVRAALLLLARASAGESPRVCLETSADTLRIAQDGLAGSGFFNLAALVFLSTTASSVALRCASQASREERARAAREFEALAVAMPGVGESVEVELHTVALDLLSEEIHGSERLFAGLSWSLPKPLSEGSRSAAIDRLVRHTPVWDRASRAGFPAARGLLAAELSQRLAPHPSTMSMLDVFQHHVDYVATVQARVRALAWALHSMEPSEDARDAAGFPRDPFDGAPLRVLTRAGEPSIPTRIWSVGPDGIDQRGDPASDDVTLELSPSVIAARPAAAEATAH